MSPSCKTTSGTNITAAANAIPRVLPPSTAYHPECVRPSNSAASHGQLPPTGAHDCCNTNGCVLTFPGYHKQRRNEQCGERESTHRIIAGADDTNKVTGDSSEKEPGNNHHDGRTSVVYEEGRNCGGPNMIHLKLKSVSVSSHIKRVHRWLLDVTDGTLDPGDETLAHPEALKPALISIPRLLLGERCSAIPCLPWYSRMFIRFSAGRSVGLMKYVGMGTKRPHARSPPLKLSEAELWTDDELTPM